MGKYEDIDPAIDAFIKELAKWKPEDYGLGNLNIINIYSDADVENAEIRRNNLFFYLKKMKDLKPLRLFVGEAPGIDGCYRTGIPFTSEAIISGAQTSTAFSWYFKDSQIHCEKEKREPTSTNVWGCLDHLGCLDQICKLLSKIPFIKEVKSLPQGVKLPLLWNIFPFQPLKNTENENEKENGELGKKECEIGMDFLLDLLEIFNIKEIYTIGNKSRDALKADAILKKLKDKNIELKGHMRHPGNGGASEFRRQFNIIYQIETEEPKDQKNKKNQENKKKQKKNRKDQNSEESEE